MSDFKIGDEVKLKPGAMGNPERPDNPTAKIQLFYSDVEGGVRLDRELRGFFSWNVLDLEPA
jgi:hypothetical protein